MIRHESGVNRWDVREKIALNSKEARVKQSSDEVAAALRKKLRDQEATGGPVDDRLRAQVASLNKAEETGQQDELDAEMRSYEGKATPTYSGGEKKPKLGPTVSANTVFTEDAAAAARAILRNKLGTLNSGLDPEILQAGITLAGYHIENVTLGTQQTRKRTAFSQRIAREIDSAPPSDAGAE